MLDKRIYINGIGGISPSMAQKGFESVAEPDYKDYILDAGVRRRMSRIIRMGVTSAFMCMKDSHCQSLDGIITGTGWGCLSDTEKFLNSILENSERMLNPTSFIQSTSNTVGAQIALLLGEKNYNNTFVHGGTSFEASMLDATLKLQEDSCANILTGGLDEMTPTKKHLLERMGVWRENSPGEGSHFFLLSSALDKFSIAEVLAVKTFSRDYAVDSIDKVNEFLLPWDMQIDQIDKIFCGDKGVEALFEDKKVTVVGFKELCGEYPTSSAFALWLACSQLRNEDELDNILIINKHLKDQFSYILIRRAKL